MYFIQSLLFLFLLLGCFSYTVYDDLFSSPKYSIKYLDERSSSDLIHGSGNSSCHTLMTPNQVYACYIPNHNSTQTFKEIGSNEASDNEIKEKAISIIKKVFQYNQCLYHFNGFWKYSFCFNSNINQYHESMEISTDMKNDAKINEIRNVKKLDYLLSEFNEHSNDPINFELVSNNFVNSNYLKQSLKTGGTCDITSKPRGVDVIYKCDSKMNKLQIVSCVETKTCQYLLVVNVPQLCQLNYFKKYKNENINEITCSEIAPFDQFDKQSVFQLKRKLPLIDYSIMPIGYNFYFGFHRHATNSPVILINNNKRYDLSEKAESVFLNNLAKSFVYVIESQKILSPITNEVLKKGDEFILKANVYDFKGDFECTIEVKNTNGNDIILSIIPDQEISETFVRYKPSIQ